MNWIIMIGIIIVALGVIYYQPIIWGIQNHCGTSLACWSFGFRHIPNIFTPKPRITNEWLEEGTIIRQTDNICLQTSQFPYLCSRTCYTRHEPRIWDMCYVHGGRVNRDVICFGDVCQDVICTDWGCEVFDDNCEQLCPIMSNWKLRG